MIEIRRGLLVFLCFLFGFLPASAQAQAEGLIAEGPVPPEMVQADVDRFVGMGAEYRLKGFPEFPNGMTPFAQWRRLDTNRLRGNEVYVSAEGARIWKTMFCGPGDLIYLELSLMNREGVQIPFAWQECRFDCEDGGSCEGSNPIYIDITGDARPEIRIDKLLDVAAYKTGFLRNPRYNFSADVLPAWLKRDFGPGLKKLSTIGPSSSVSRWKDHPLAVGSTKEIGR